MRFDAPRRMSAGCRKFAGNRFRVTPLIELNDPRLADPRVVIIDVRAGVDAHQRYLSGHLPRAIFADLDKDLSSKPADPAYGGRHPLPAPAEFAATLTRWGITPDTAVVAYDDKGNAMGGARLWWMLRAIGHRGPVQVLNGALRAAVDAGIPLSTDDVRPVASSQAYPVPSAYEGTVDIEETGAAAQSEDRLVIDVREDARYLGRTEPIDLIAGHIPGAENLFLGKNMGADGRYLSAGELRKLYASALGDTQPENVILHCGSGVSACHTLLGMASVGIDEPKLYVGSWSEWSRRGLPITTEPK
jgi:thiosulfate/3-mercaptopyruvate sulfurtransferase